MTKKLYGQINPKTKSGGCHDGAFKDLYQLSPVFTQKPEPIAYTAKTVKPKNSEIFRNLLVVTTL